MADNRPIDETGAEAVHAPVGMGTTIDPVEQMANQAKARTTAAEQAAAQKTAQDLEQESISELEKFLKALTEAAGTGISQVHAKHFHDNGTYAEISESLKIKELGKDYAIFEEQDGSSAYRFDSTGAYHKDANTNVSSNEAYKSAVFVFSLEASYTEGITITGNDQQQAAYYAAYLDVKAQLTAEGKPVPTLNGEAEMLKAIPEATIQEEKQKLAAFKNTPTPQATKAKASPPAQTPSEPELSKEDAQALFDQAQINGGVDVALKDAERKDLSQRTKTVMDAAIEKANQAAAKDKFFEEAPERGQQAAKDAVAHRLAAHPELDMSNYGKPDISPPNAALPADSTVSKFGAPDVEQPDPERLQHKTAATVELSRDGKSYTPEKRAEKIESLIVARQITSDPDVYNALKHHVIETGKASKTAIKAFLLDETNAKSGLTEGITKDNVDYAAKVMTSALKSEDFISARSLFGGKAETLAVSPVADFELAAYGAAPDRYTNHPIFFNFGRINDLGPNALEPKLPVLKLTEAQRVTPEQGDFNAAADGSPRLITEAPDAGLLRTLNRMQPPQA